MPQVGYALNQLDWTKVEAVINDVFQDANIQITVFMKTSKDAQLEETAAEDSSKTIIVHWTFEELVTLVPLATAQTTHPQLKKLFQWVSGLTIPFTQKFTTWHKNQ